MDSTPVNQAPTEAPLALPPLEVPRTAAPKTRLGRWLFAIDVDSGEHQRRSWRQVLWLTGVDYFSTLGYQPGIALLAAGFIAPFATLILVAVTLFAAYPVYAQVAKRSFQGQGSIAMLGQLLPGWASKTVVLLLLGFASTDFVITMTLSAADAGVHVVENPLLKSWLGSSHMGVTLAFLVLLAVFFMRGFKEVIAAAMLAAIPYLLLNAVVVLRGSWEIVQHPEHLAHWGSALEQLGRGSDWALAAALVFPQLALGLSGFETGVSVMPLIQKERAEDTEPEGRIAATRKLLLTSALVMSGFLIGTSLVTTLLVPEEAFRHGGPAAGRAMAFLAHRHLGHAFGTLYDVSTVLVLGFAGASAMAGMLHLLPRYLPRFGMAPRWVGYTRPLVFTLLIVNILVTLAFKANVEAQGGAYATGVLVLMLSAAVAVALSLARERRPLGSLYFWIVSAVFLFTVVENVRLRPDGLYIASMFVLAILVVCAISRYRRSTELRVAHLTLKDASTVALWDRIRGRKANLVPLKHASPEDLARKAQELRQHYVLDGPLAFLHVHLADDRSEFLSDLTMDIRSVGQDFLIEVHGAVAVANTIAYVSEQLDPTRLFLGLTGGNLMQQAFRYLLWGEGETGLMVYKILVQYWEWTPEGDVKPMIFLMSE